LAIVSVIALLVFFCVRRRRSKGEHPTEAHELHTVENAQELPDMVQISRQDSAQISRQDSAQISNQDSIQISRQDLEGFEFPFQQHEATPVEIDSQTVRAQSRGRVVGTETTAFDFESQKVLLTPDLLDKSRASSRVPVSSPTSLRRHNTDT
jgi:hypothetical protein